MTHAQCLDAAAAYALGALDVSQRLAFDEHLLECSACSAELDAFRGVAGLLAYAAPMASIPNAAALRERIIADAAKSRPLAEATSRVAADPVPAVTTPVLASSETALSASTPVLSAWTPAFTASTKAHTSASRAARISASRLPWLAAAAGLTIAVVSGAAYLNIRSDRARLVRALETTRRDAEGTRALLAARDSVLSAFLGSSVHVVSLSEGADKKPSARIFWNHTTDVFIITAFSVPQAPRGRVYQLWAMKTGKAPMSMGTFNPDPSGRALAIMPVGSIADAGVIDGCAMTMEPEGGSKQPTETPRLLGAWRHAD